MSGHRPRALGGPLFADDYPRFIELSELTPGPNPKRAFQDHRTADEQRNRMNERYEAMFGSNRDIFEGARVLDLASHDGRYSFAALKTGAAHVTGVEVRQSLIDRAQASFEFYDQDPDTYRFVCGDIFEVLEKEQFEVDVVLCFGFLYHTYRHTELLYRLHQLKPTYIIMDTMVTLDRGRTLKMIRERDVEDIRSAAPDPFSVGRVLVLRPSVPALALLMRAYDFDVESLYDWPGRFSDRPVVPGLEGYAKGKRVTMRCRSRAAARAAGLPPVAPLPALEEKPRRKRRPAPKPVPEQGAGGWRDKVNHALARTTGYELKRVSGRP